MTLSSGNKRLEGQVAIVTGASRGLGRAIALAFAQEGAKVAVAARTEQVWNERLPGTVFETAAEIEKIGGIALPVRCDVSVEEDLVGLVDTVREKLGPINVLVNNAALTVPGRPPKEGAAPAQRPPSSGAQEGAPRRPSGPMGFMDFPLRGYRLHFEIGTFASFRLMQLVLPDMVEAGQGSVVNISSGASLIPPEGPYPDAKGSSNLAYGGNKSALEHLTRAVAYEMSQYGVAVNCLRLDIPIMTPGLEVMIPDAVSEDTPENFAEATIRLAVADPAVTNGWVANHEEILKPETRRR